MEGLGITGTCLHVGCGPEHLPDWLDAYDEVRLDIDRACKPDIHAPMTRMGDIGPFDVVYSSHALEHVLPVQVPQVLFEMRRVLHPGGQCIVIVPDLEGVSATTDVLVKTPAGDTCGLDLIYGHHTMTANNPLMCHRCGFVAETLVEAMRKAGFNSVSAKRLPNYNLFAAGIK